MSQQDPRTYAIIGAAMEVHRQLGPGFLESVYQEALSVEMTSRQIPFCREVSLEVRYKNVPLSCRFKADFVCFESVLVELKSLAAITGNEEAQVLNYLKATTAEVAVLLNFGETSLTYRRYVPHNSWMSVRL